MESHNTESIQMRRERLHLEELQLQEQNILTLQVINSARETNDKYEGVLKERISDLEC